MNVLKIVQLLTTSLVFITNLAISAESGLYRWVNVPEEEALHVSAAKKRLILAIKNPEFMLDNWIELPTSPKASTQKKLHLTLREAILLALRYNPNIQNAALDRVVQRYQLRLAHNEFELQYALGGTAATENSRYSQVGNTVTNSYVATPEFDLKTKLGSQVGLTMENPTMAQGNYNPLLNLSFNQPLLRGFGKGINEANLRNAIDSDYLNKLNLKQAVIDQVTQVVIAYRALVLSGNNLQNQRHQLHEARNFYSINEKKIAAGQLEPTANIQQSYQIESLQLLVEQAVSSFTTAALDLLQAIGLDPDMALAVPSDIVLPELQVPNLQQSIDQAFLHNTSFQALKMSLRADERAYTVAQNQQLWQLDVSANVQAGTITGVDGTKTGLLSIYNGNNLTESAGVRLTIPLHDISRRQQLINAKVRLEKDRLSLIAAKRALITTIKNTINSITSQAKRYELARRQVRLAAKSYSLEKRKQAAGIASALEVTYTQNQLIQAQIGLINAKIAYLNQITALERLLGTTLDDWNIHLRYGANA